MTEEERVKKVRTLQKLFPNQKIYPHLSHVYGQTIATLKWETSFNVTEVRKPVVVEALKDLIQLLQCAIDDMPENKDVLDKIQDSSSDPAVDDSV